MSGWNIAAAIAFFTIFLTIWKQIYSSLKNVNSFITGKIEIDTYLSSSVYSYCNNHCKLLPFRQNTYSGIRTFIKNNENARMIAFDMMSHKMIIYRKGWRFLLISPGQSYWNFRNNSMDRSYNLFVPRFMWNSEKFIQNCTDYYNSINNEEDIKQRLTRFSIRKLYGKSKITSVLSLDSQSSQSFKDSGAGYEIKEAQQNRARPIGCSVEELETDSNRIVDPFSIFHYPPEIMEAVEDAKLWFGSKSWYRRKFIPWKMGWLVKGKPGSGKTLLLKSVAQSLDIPVFLFDLASMSNEEFNTSWEDSSKESPCMIVFEDFDTVFKQRKNIATENPDALSFGTILNGISGMQESDGIFLAITVNNIEHIDSAIAINENENIPSRPGRIDKIITINDMTEQCRKHFAARMLEKSIDSTEVDKIVIEGKGLTAAQFNELCRRHCIGLLRLENKKIQHGFIEKKPITSPSGETTQSTI